MNMKKKYIFYILAYMLAGRSSYAQFTTILNFEGTTNGSTPYGSLLSEGSFLFGMTLSGGTDDFGSIFKIMPDGTGYEKLMDFAGITNGRYPYGTLISDGTFLYGMTAYGGLNDLGTIFKINPNGTSYEKLMDFEGTTNGRFPTGSLIYDGTFLYGMTQLGGTNDLGTIFKIMPDGTGYEKLMDFAGTTNGSAPGGSLIYDGTFLYGMTYKGGTNDIGTIFKIMPDGTSYYKLIDFEGVTNGSKPIGSLMFDGMFLYAMTYSGGVNDLGTVFKIIPDGTGYVKLLEFDGVTNGSLPEGSLISDGTFLYGMNRAGGLNNLGTIFKIMLNGNGYIKLLDFEATMNGSTPYGSLISDGIFLFGMTCWGGINNNGVVFKISKTVGVDEITTGPEVTISPNPSDGIVDISTSINGIHFISITNILGEAVLSKAVYMVAGSTFTIDMSEQQAGIYFLRVGNCTKRIIRK
jgi:uncharacterized repeat protein (TIGR03803 family)